MLRDAWRVARDPVSFAALGFGLGLMPWMPGTFGALLAFPLMWLIAGLNSGLQLAIILLISAAGIGICGRAGAVAGQERPWLHCVGRNMRLCAGDSVRACQLVVVASRLRCLQIFRHCEALAHSLAG